MYKVLVVDDEPASLSHVCSIIDKKCPDYEVIMTAENGQDALEKVRICQPDLILSDVKMPLLSGLELVSKVKEEFPDIYSIILSGYSDFEYAQTAIKEGVCDYILKPVSPMGLQKSLEKISKKMKKKYSAKRNYIIHKLCNGFEVDEKVISEYFPYQKYYGAIVRRNGLPRRFSTINNIEIYSDINEYIMIYGRDEMESFYIIAEDLLLESSFEEYLVKISQKNKMEQDYITLVYKNESFSVSELPKVIKAIYKTLDTNCIVGVNQIIEMNQKEPCKTTVDSDTVNSILPKLEYLLKEQQTEKLKKEIKRLYKQWEDEKKTQLRLEYMTRHILYMMHRYNSTSSPFFECEYMMEDAFFYATTMEELTENLCEIMFQFIRKPNTIDKLDSPEWFYSIEDYCQRHIGDSISLKSICEVFCVSQTYLSRLFRKYEGKSFNNYLTEIRIEAAKKIMNSNPEVFVKDVAAMVGYNDQFYFSRVFRSYTGVPPTEYIEKNNLSLN